MIERGEHFIQEAIEQLYQQAEIPLPRPPKWIVPLGALVGTFNLVCRELSGLTQQVAMDYLLQRSGIVELPEQLIEEPLAGYLYVNTFNGCIFVEANDPLVRRRFSVAHELGHYLLHFQPLLEIAKRDREYLEITELLRLSGEERSIVHEMSSQTTMQESIRKQLPPAEQMEREADQFAAELLMPTPLVQRLFARYGTYLRDDDLVWRLATEMLVSGESMRIRLRELGFLPTAARGI